MRPLGSKGSRAMIPVRGHRGMDTGYKMQDKNGVLVWRLWIGYIEDDDPEVHLSGWSAALG